jgi:hypothetical protein
MLHRNEEHVLLLLEILVMILQIRHSMLSDVYLREMVELLDRDDSLQDDNLEIIIERSIALLTPFDYIFYLSI